MRHKSKYDTGRFNGSLLINYKLIRAAMNEDACVDALRWALTGHADNGGRWFTLAECAVSKRSYLMWLVDSVPDLPQEYKEEIYLLTGYAVIRIVGNRRIIFNYAGRHVSGSGRSRYYRAPRQRSAEDLQWRPKPNVVPKVRKRGK